MKIRLWGRIRPSCAESSTVFDGDDSAGGRPIGLIIRLIDRGDQGLSIGGLIALIGPLEGKIYE